MLTFHFFLIVVQLSSSFFGAAGLLLLLVKEGLAPVPLVKPEASLAYG